MRILYIVTAYPRWAGDVITPWLIETIARLRERGVEVEVLAPSYRGCGDQTIAGVAVHRFRYAPRALETLTHDQTTPDRIRERPWYLGLVPGYFAAGTLAASRLARQGRFDVMHSFWPLPHGLMGLGARRFSGVPLISTFFGVELTWVRRQLPLLSPLLRTTIRKSDAVTVISSHTEAEVLRLEPTARVLTIPFGAAVEEQAAERPATRPRPRQHGAPFELLFVGRLVERKGVSYLLRAVARVTREHPIRLTVVGDGPLRSRLQEEAKALGITDQVEFTGFIPEESLSDRFAHSDAFVLPAIRDSKGDVEGLGVVLLEAMAHATPVIASDSGGIRDIVIHDRTGLLTTPGDVDSLVTAIRRMIVEDGLHERLVSGARGHMARNFSWDTIIDRLVALYSEVVATRSSAATAGREALR